MTTQRIHALDALRAIMMLLGIVLHTCLSYTVVTAEKHWFFNDPHSTWIGFDFMFSVIHFFRMPIFFMVAGFFAALLFYERSAQSMLKNRLQRIVYPFLVFVMLLWLMNALALGFAFEEFKAAGFPISDKYGPRPFHWTQLFPKVTMHLWFLYYLIWLSALGWLFGKLTQAAPNFFQKFNSTFSHLLQQPFLKLLIPTLLTFFMLCLIDQDWIRTPISWVPNIKALAFYAVFYFFGWFLYQSKTQLHTFQQHAGIFTSIALFLAVVQFIGIEFPFLTRFINALLVWSFVYGITGLFFRFLNRPSNRMRYISDASYWIYLIHLPLTIVLPTLLIGWTIPAVLKFLIAVIVASMICLVTYHYGVRGTFVGQFLNGRRYR